ncbi:SdrD B-like domain-containing protein [uncultured Fibrella sp.]|uniref:SdrD B-like domain-containing protein n=1 Tax=uncultured Fibrella sp. TaxID=1284596 RepID=UPI0035C96315
MLPALAQAQTITGTVFRDFDANGTYVAIPASGTYTYGEPGVAGVIVTAYSSNSATAPISATTTSSGAYTLIVNSSAEFRLEFTNVVSGDFDSFVGAATTASKSSVRFVTGGTTGVNFGVNYPANYCQSTFPQLVTTCFVAINATNSPVLETRPALIGIPYTAVDNSSTVTDYATVGEVGASWGIAYKKDTRQLFSAAFTKRHVGFSDGGPNAIYVTNVTSATSGNTSVFFNFTSVGGTAVSTASETHSNDLPTPSTGSPTTLQIASHDNNSFTAVGKTSLGDIELSDDGKTLYVVNLKNRSLYSIDVATKLVTGVVAIPNPGCTTSGTTVNGSYRPFALKYYRDKLYIGVVCTREDLGSTTVAYGSSPGLSATVYAIDPATLTGSTAFSSVLAFPLTYKKQPTNADLAGQPRAEYWRPWTTVFQADRTDPFSYPQAWLSGIEFEPGTGDMIIGLRDRFGDQMGYQNYLPFSSATTLVSAISPGEILRARKCTSTAPTWTIESAGSLCGSPTSTTQANSQGPGDGKYYWGDRVQDGDNHGISSQGSLAQLAGSARVAMTAIDPVDQFNTGGIKRLINATGAKDGIPTGTAYNPGAGVEFYTSSGLTYGKANGLGDLEALCNLSPIQIGNRVWVDTDNDGVQDPGEPALGGVVVQLKGPGITGSVSVTTNAQGEYYFSNATGTNSLGFVYGLTNITSGGSYTLTFPTSASAGTLALSTKANSATGTNADRIDTDPTAAGVVSFTLGNAGENNFTYDAAYIAPICSLSLTPTVSGCYNTTAGSRATVSVEVAWENAPTSNTITVTFGGQTRTITTGTFSVTYTPFVSGQQVIVSPQVVAFEVPADGSTQPLRAFFGTSFAVSTCNSQTTVTLPVACVPVPCVAASGQTGGNVFKDYDADGVKDATETIGQSGIVVKAFDCLGNLVGTTTTDLSGNYSFTGLTAASYPIRVEFSAIPALLGQGTVNGANGRTTTQFVAAPSCAVDLGVSNPNDYCQSMPMVVIPCFTYGDPLPNGSASGLVDALVAFPYGTSGPKDMTKITMLAQAKEIGTVWGVSYDKYRKKTYSSATLKRHAGLGPLGLGGIYVTDMATAATTPLVNVTALGINVGSSTAADPWFGVTNASRGLGTDPTVGNTDPRSFSLIGKIGIGDLEISEDGNSLYFVNMYDKKLYVLALNGGTPTLSGSYAIPDPGCAGGNFRPFALKVYRGSVYVGSVCDGLTTQDKSEMRAYVHQFTGGTFASAPAFDFPLTYPKGYAVNLRPNIVGWYPWTDDFTKLPTTSQANGSFRTIYPQPIFTDIEFDIDGSMVLGFGDRTGFQTGYRNLSPLGGTALYDGVSGGDILRAAFTNGTYILENNAKIPGITGAGVNNNQGPGFGEFYNDDLLFVPTDLSHAEIALGGLALLPGSGQVLISAMDPINIFNGGSFNAAGVRYLNNTTGLSPSGSAQGFILYASDTDTGTFGKATGLGDLELTCDVPTYLEIGNRVWNDANRDGVQDPCEPPLAGVIVSLYNNGTLVASTTTNASGEYYFNNNPVSSTVAGTVSNTAIQPNTAYQIVFGKTQFSNNQLTVGGQQYMLTIPNSTTTNANDQNDSDALIATVAGITSPVISVTTGAAGSVNHTYDVGFYQPASLGDYTFVDTNKDGIQNTGDVALPGVTVTLYLNGSAVATTTTNASGFYSFTGLTPGTSNSYVVGFTAPAGYTATISNVGSDTADSDASPITGKTQSVTLAPGEYNPTLDAGFYLIPASLGDYAFIDTNKDGIQNGGDSPLPGVTVTLYQNGSAVATTTTNASGLYSFTGLTPGSATSYVVGFTAPAGYTATISNVGSDTADSDAGPVTGMTQSVTLTPGEYNPTLDAGFYLIPASLGDYTFIDTNKDGIQNAGDSPLAGVTVTLYRNGSAVATTTTNGSGFYSFTGLTPGTSNSYVVGFTTPAGFTATISNVGSDTADSDADLITGRTQSVTLTPGEYNPTLDAGFYMPTAGLGDYVFEDKNANGIQDAGDLPISGVTVTLYASGTIVRTTSTDINGLYSFTGLTPGTSYTVGFGQPAGYVPTLANAGNDGLDSDASTTTGLTGPYSLTADEFNPTVDAGFYKLASLGDYVFNDKNRDGIQNTGDTPIPGVTVVLYLNGSPVATTATDANGLYSFTGLTPGTANTYSVGFTQPMGFSATSANVGFDGLDSDADPVTGRTSGLTLTSGESNTSVDAGFYQPTASLGNFVFEDVNKDGLQDGGDLPIPGAVVTLLQSGTLAATTLTDANGLYSFTGLTPGIPYSVSFTNPTGYSTTTTANAGSNDAIDSDPVGGITAPLTLTAGENNTSLDAGFVRALVPPLTFAIAKTVSNSRPERGGMVTYTISLTNTSVTSATNVVITDAFSTSGLSVVGSATATTGTFTPSPTGGSWSLPTLAGGQVATLRFQVQVNTEGLVYNTVTTPDGTTASACLTVPIHVCANTPFEFGLSAPASYSTYQWSLNGTPIPGATSATYSATVVGEYTVATSTGAGCPDGSCCPFVVVADPVPNLTAVGLAATCTGATPLNNAAITLVGSNTAAVSYNISAGSSFTASAPLFATNQPLSGLVNGAVLLANQANPAVAPGTSYTIRVYSVLGCFSDVVVVIPPAQCQCPPTRCIPLLVKKVARR